MKVTPSLVVHGGTGQWAENQEAAVTGVRTAAELGWSLLIEGSPALDVVEAAVRILEDDPVFDAGRGSFVNTGGHVELDAIVMDGATLRTGAVAAIRNFANPVSVARLVMERTPHNLLVGDGARDFAMSMGLSMVPEEYLLVDKEFEKWQMLHRNGGSRRSRTERHRGESGKGTVGVVARDVDGNIAVATSTGGMPDKMPGRVGDSPLVGCGAYADNLLGGASGTGLGEALMKVVMAKAVCDLMGQGLPAQEAAGKAVKRLDDPRIKGWGGVIALDAEGRVGIAYNAPHMARAYVTPDGQIVAEI